MIWNFDIAVTGLAAISAAGVGVDALARAVAGGESHLTPAPAEFAGEGAFWGKAGSFRPGDFMPPLKARKFDRCSLFAVAAAGMAAGDAGLGRLDPDRIGITLGAGFGGIDNSTGFLRGYYETGAEGLAPMLFPNTVPNASASNASIEHGFRGVNVTFVQRFCSAESALLLALQALEAGKADAMLSGGTDDLTTAMLRGFRETGQFRSHARWFGEGAGIVVLERRRDAEARGAAILGGVTAVRTVGALVPGRESEGVQRLLPDSAPYGVALSGTAGDIPGFRRTAELARKRVELGPLVGRSLAMGGLSLVALLALLPPGETGLLLSASPEGPFYAVEVTGADPLP